MWDITMAVNVRSVYLSCKYAIAQMLKQEPHTSGDKGWIINMSSIFGLVGGHYNGQFQELNAFRLIFTINASALASYAASKGAVSNLTRQVAVDYAEDRIHCNAICPGCT
jgi:NAD(P)-dependent dehydrogenase (short-subunit alcohol dehydrogenase family)